MQGVKLRSIVEGNPLENREIWIKTKRYSAVSADREAGALVHNFAVRYMYSRFMQDSVTDNN